MVRLYLTRGAGRHNTKAYLRHAKILMMDRPSTKHLHTIFNFNSIAHHNTQQFQFQIIDQQEQKKEPCLFTHSLIVSNTTCMCHGTGFVCRDFVLQLQYFAMEHSVTELGLDSQPSGPKSNYLG